MSAAESFYADAHQAPNVTHIVAGRTTDHVALHARGHRMLIVICGEASGEMLLECFASAETQGVLRNSMHTLVDMTGFIGAIDWGAVSSLRARRPWGEGAPGASRVAYLLRNTAGFALIKILGSLFQHTQHRAFVDRQAAVAWLEAENREA